MYLSQEYLDRHGLKVTHALYDSNINVVLRSNNFQWLVLHGEWNPPGLHPGYYVFQMFRPLYNGCEQPLYGPKKAFTPVTDQSIVHWDEYELFILNWVRKCDSLRLRGFSAIETQREAELVCWEMFLYIFDKWLAENMDGKFFDLVLNSTLPSVPLMERRDSFLYATDMLENYSAVHSPLQNIIFTYAKRGCYSEWLAKLANTNA
jgi:hypothetical protein